jgi:hypothetical protein
LVSASQKFKIDDIFKDMAVVLGSVVGDQASEAVAAVGRRLATEIVLAVAQLALELGKLRSKGKIFAFRFKIYYIIIKKRRNKHGIRKDTLPRRRTFLP